MNCLQAEEYFSAHFEGTLDKKTSQRFEEHLAGCPTCEREYDNFQKTMGLLQHLPEIEPPPYITPGLLERIEQHKRGGAVDNPFVPGWRRLLESFRRPVWAVSGVMVLIFLVAGVYMYQDRFLFEGDSGPSIVTPAAPEAEVAPPPVETEDALEKIKSVRQIPEDARLPDMAPLGGVDLATGGRRDDGRYGAHSFRAARKWNGPTPTTKHPMQRHYVLRQVKYTGGTTEGGL